MVADGVIQDYAVAGAIAAAVYIEPKATEDIDIFVHVKAGTPMFGELTDIYEYLKNRGFKPREGYVEMAGWDVQFLVPADGSVEDEGVREANTISLHGVDIRVMMPEYLVALALNVGREKDIDRARAFILQKKVNVEDLKTLVERFGLEERWQRVRMLL